MIDELSALHRIEERFQKISKNVFVGIGDDASALKTHPEKLLLATTDSQVENVHFSKGTISFEQLARRSVAVSVSDIAAMGGVPRFILASVGFTKAEDESFLDGIMSGFKQGQNEFGVELVGGNLSSADGIFIGITVLGEVEPELLVKRKGARAGDAVYVTGSLGDSALGLRMIQDDNGKSPDKYLSLRHLSPQPRLALGRELAKRCLATSMIDISDGLLLDLERITVFQGLGAEIKIDRLPLSDEYRERVAEFETDIHKLALSGGEDYELLFTSTKENEREIKKVSESLNVKITKIGFVTSEPDIKILGSDGKQIKTDQRGFIHTA